MVLPAPKLHATSNAQPMTKLEALLQQIFRFLPVEIGRTVVPRSQLTRQPCHTVSSAERRQNDCTYSIYGEYEIGFPNACESRIDQTKDHCCQHVRKHSQARNNLVLLVDNLARFSTKVIALNASVLSDERHICSIDPFADAPVPAANGR